MPESERRQELETAACLQKKKKKSFLLETLSLPGLLSADGLGCSGRAQNSVFASVWTNDNQLKLKIIHNF